jgi:hypothetical protein
MDLNIITFTYLFLRLAPFILVCFFSLESLFNQDFKGLVYLAGLLISVFMTTMISNGIPSIVGERPVTRLPMCNVVTIGFQGEISKLPLSQTVFGYTFAYLLSAMTSKKHNIINQNIPTVLFFVLLILFDFIWNFKYECYLPGQLGMSLIIGIIAGFIWGAVIESTNNSSLRYFPGATNKEVCSKPSGQTFKCKVYKGGEPFAS